MSTHELKTWPEYYKATAAGAKTFEVRKCDRDFKVGDTLLLREFAPCGTCNGSGLKASWQDYNKPDYVPCCPKPHGTYTGNSIAAGVTYVLRDGPFLPHNLCVMAIVLAEEHVE